MTHIDAQTLTAVINAHGAALVLYARQWCRTPDDAVQEALIELVRQNSTPDDVAAWLHTCVRRRAMNLGRADSRRDNHHRQAGLERESWFLPQELDPDEPIDYEMYLARLPSLDREIVVARIWSELTFSQIAEIVGQPISTVHRRYGRGIAELERMMNHFKKNPTKEFDESRPSLT